MDKRRAAKVSGNRQAANMISRELKRAIRKDKDAHYQRMCIEMEKEHWKGRSRAAYVKIKEIKRKFQPRTGILKNAKGTMLTEPEVGLGIVQNFSISIPIP